MAAGAIRNRSSEEVGPGLVLGGREGNGRASREREDSGWSDGAGGGGGGRQLRDCLDWRHFKRTEKSINLAGCGQLIKTVRAKRLILHLVFGPSGSVLGT